ncbi:hypothetical protein KL921_005231 [Ogataea angusta]|uniref:Uncharacterized protein n=1 Tax=Pichia angusta TaxID=870730 RepID=A0AAN6I4F4_PICAN|nr:uncharacterized protein KL928_004732 [Ogataea angusta]KAG7805918.1 hypothetical protein KL921_005231 [Ogataea angusta]KAG7816690.1 hypothetical protein KL928_004732 [Ogataea angusta]KAG7823109.1 hypothetical protein KL909_003712 [Ogataea angusta]KAG7828280.1 hypothetical protein KL920_004007 [Ogataea angusta]KAG7835369.1 hypothetical protein KL942_005383 [Ogataea angusta]
MRFLSLTSALAALASLAAAEELTTYSLVINRNGAVFTKVLTSTVGNTDLGYAAQYATDTSIHVYTVGDAEASSSFWAYVNGATSTESSSTATSTAETTSTTEASSSEVTSTAESTEASATSSSAAELTTESVVLYKNNHLFTKVVTNTVGVENPEKAANAGNTNVLAYTVGDASASASFYSALYERTASAQSSYYSSGSSSSAAASSAASVATYEGAAAETVARVGLGALLSGMAVLLM